MNAQAHFTRLARYNMWATQQLLFAMAPVHQADHRCDLRLFFKRIHGSLHHLLVGKHLLRQRRFWLGESPGEWCSKIPPRPFGAEPWRAVVLRAHASNAGCVVHSGEPSRLTLEFAPRAPSRKSHTAHSACFEHHLKVALDRQVEPASERDLPAQNLKTVARVWEPLIARWPAEPFDGKLARTNMRGQASSPPFAATLARMFNHSTHRRGQISAAPSPLGQAAAALDLVFFLQQTA